jgi:hypothetical protein
MGPIRDILEELEATDENEWPEGMPPPVERMESLGKGPEAPGGKEGGKGEGGGKEQEGEGGARFPPGESMPAFSDQAPP